jgi:hypothetical protein
MTTSAPTRAMKPMKLSVYSIALGAVLFNLCACAVQIVSDYDEQIDSGLTQLNTEITAFVNKMISTAGSPAGTYASNIEFYSTENAKIDTLIVRAEAHRVLKSCPTSDVMSASLKANTPPAPVTSVIPMPDISAALANTKKDDCSVVLMNLIKTGFGQLAEFHKDQGTLGIPMEARDPVLVGGLGSLIHSAITVEVALKSGKTPGAANGT